MSASIDIKLSGDALAILPRITDKPGLFRAIAREIDLQNEFTIAHIQSKKLSGPTSPTTLSVRTGLLRRSIRRTNAVVTATGAQGSIGSNVAYAGVHEFGFQGSVQVPEHERKIVVGTATAFTKSGKKKKIIVGGKTTVSAHSRQMNFPARRFIFSSLEERAHAYSAGLGGAIMRFWKGGA